MEYDRAGLRFNAATNGLIFARARFELRGHGAETSRRLLGLEVAELSLLVQTEAVADSGHGAHVSR